MCGIVGYIGHQPAWPIVFQGLQRLEYRGYDSAGIAIVDAEGELQLRKQVGKVASLLPAPQTGFPQGRIGLGHTRWATHGRPTVANAHPHTDCHGRVAVVHNGIVENFMELKRGLQARGHRFTSETDTETIAHLLEEGLDQGLAFPDAFRKLGGLLRGSQAIAAIMIGERRICAMRLGHAGGIVAAHKDGQVIVGSDLPALTALLDQDGSSGPDSSSPVRAAFLEAGEMLVAAPEGLTFQDLEGRALNKVSRTVFPEEVQFDRSGHRHFMLKEIMEEPAAVASALRERVDFERGRVVLPDFPITPRDIKQLRRVVLIGCGTSLHAAQIGRHLVERLAGLPAEAESASEFRYRRAYIDAQTLVVAVGQSGETADTVAAMHEVKDRGGRLIAICNQSGSQATRVAEGSLLMRSGAEIGVASSKTFIASLTILNLLAVYLGQVRGALSEADAARQVEDLARLPNLIGDVLADTAGYQRLARRLSDYHNFLFLGRGMNAPIALEGALKLKEISYIHAEGYPAGEMKHGPIALIDRTLATVALAPRDSLYEKMVNNIKEVKARDGLVLAVLTQDDEELAGQVDEVLWIPPAPEQLTPLLTTIPLQLLAYHIAVQRGCDVDQPRNLAKSVTVE
ncbi:MAG: glutamine--fructose-6-phosphate transaminase (isomerizing) [Dehalococcoidia bacterium]|nr:glutamine--fructose-6-phosphate transaminase (isomerizing) [Dehalococcoidia bacterium]